MCSWSGIAIFSNSAINLDQRIRHLLNNSRLVISYHDSSKFICNSHKGLYKDRFLRSHIEHGTNMYVLNITLFSLYILHEKALAYVSKVLP